MLTTPHLLVGAAIGSQMPSAWQVVPVAAASHFLLDSIPHFQGKIEVEDLEKKEVLFLLADLFVGFGILFLISFNSPVRELMWVGALSAVLPDFHHIIQVLFGQDAMKQYHSIHMKFHFKRDIRLIPGFATQIVTIVIAIFIARQI